MGDGVTPSYSLNDPTLAVRRSFGKQSNGTSGPAGASEFQAIDAPPDPPDLTDEAVKQAKQAQLLQGMSMTGYQSTFISGAK